MLASYNELCSFVDLGVISPVSYDDVNGTSIDVHLGNVIKKECYSENGPNIVSLRDKQNVNWRTVDITDSFYLLGPGEFILAHTVEIFNLPDYVSAEFKLNSSGARIGLDNALATWCDPRWNGSSLTLELRNNTRHHTIRLDHRCRIGQMVFHLSESVPEEKSYAVRGRYNGDKFAQPVK